MKGIDLDMFLQESPDTYYDELFDRIDDIKRKLRSTLHSRLNAEQIKSSSKCFIPLEISTLVEI